MTTMTNNNINNGINNNSGINNNNGGVNYNVNSNATATATAMTATTTIPANMQTAVQDLNLFKMMFVTFDNGKMIPETMLVDYFQANKIKSRFAVIGRMTHSLLEFSNLKSALKFVTLLAEDMHFFTREFYDNFRIVEITGPDDKPEILSIIVNLVDYWDILIGIVDGKLNKAFFSDEDFNEYYVKYSQVV